MTSRIWKRDRSEIGSGSFGVVHTYTQEDDTKYAVKTIKYDNKKTWSSVSSRSVYYVYLSSSISQS